MVVITGATGLLGTHLTERFVAEGIAVAGLHRVGRDHKLPDTIKKIQGNVLDPVSLQEAFQGATTVVHSAAYVSFNPRRRKKLINVNVGGTQHVVNACLQAGVNHLIHISSVAALGRMTGQPTSEESRWNEDVFSDYSESKYLAELEVFRGAEEGLTVSIVNPSVILSAKRMHRSSAALLDYVWHERKFYTDGTLNYVDARDVSDAVFKLYQQPQPGQKFILSAGSIPYRDFFSMVAGRLHKKPASVRISAGLAYVAGALEELRAILTGGEPLVTRTSARLAREKFEYDHRKANSILGIQFKSLEETVAWCCEDYLRNVKVNK